MPQSIFVITTRRLSGKISILSNTARQSGRRTHAYPRILNGTNVSGNLNEIKRRISGTMKHMLKNVPNLWSYVRIGLPNGTPTTARHCDDIMKILLIVLVEAKNRGLPGPKMMEHGAKCSVKLRAR